jgi:hypothetical protein
MAMSAENEELKALQAMANDTDVPVHLRLGALKELGKRRESNPEISTEPDPLGVMRSVVDRHCPQTPEERDLPPDPMRALDFEAFTGRRADRVAFSWLPYCPENPGAAERAILAAARRLGVGTGPYELPDDDELSRRRRRQGRA